MCSYSQLSARKAFIFEWTNSETVYALMCHNMHLVSGFAIPVVLPVCFVLTLSLCLVFLRQFAMASCEKQCARETGVEAVQILYVGFFFVVKMKRAKHTRILMDKMEVNYW